MTVTRGRKLSVQRVMVFMPFVGWGLHTGCHELEQPTRRIIDPKTTSKEHLPPTSRTSAELLDVNLRLFGGYDDTVRGLNFSKYKELSPILCRDAPLSTMYIWSFDFMTGVVVDASASSSVGE